MKHEYLLMVTRTDGSYYVLEGHPDELRALEPKADIYGNVADVRLLRRRVR